MVEKNFDNRFRHGKCQFELAETSPVTVAASGARFEKAIFDQKIGSEIVIRLTDSTPFAYELKREPFTLRLKSGIAQTSEGPVLFLLWWIPPITDGKPFALYEQILNPTHAGTLEGLRQVARQTHLHLLLVGPDQALLDIYEFENTFGLEGLVSVSESAREEFRSMDFIAAKQEYELTYDLMGLFGMNEPTEAQEQVKADIAVVNSIPGEAPVDLRVSDYASAEGRVMVLNWNEVEAAALRAFDVWERGGELDWAKNVWERAVAAGFSDYSNEIERHRVAVLFLGLAGLYRDFCSVAWDERDAPYYSHWAEGLSLDDFVLGQLVGPDPGIEESSALNQLVNAARPQVVRLLRQLFGNTNSLFISLWRAGPANANEGYDDCDGAKSLTDDEILNDATPEKLAAYGWLNSGAEVVLDPY
jgi:hypothetical protein